MPSNRPDPKAIVQPGEHPCYFAPLRSVREWVQRQAGSSCLARPSHYLQLFSRPAEGHLPSNPQTRCTDDKTHDLGGRRKLQRLVLLSLPVGVVAQRGEHRRRARLQSRGRRASSNTPAHTTSNERRGPRHPLGGRFKRSANGSASSFRRRPPAPLPPWPTHSGCRLSP
jgi:hypothetical protein